MGQKLTQCCEDYSAEMHIGEYDGYGDNKTYKIFTPVCKNWGKSHVGASFSEYRHGKNAETLATKHWNNRLEQTAA